MLRLRPVLEKYNVTYVTVSNSYKQDVSDENFYTISDATRWNKMKLILMALQISYSYITYSDQMLFYQLVQLRVILRLRLGKMIRSQNNLD